jgi:hypothetical protein
VQIEQLTNHHIRCASHNSMMCHLVLRVERVHLKPLTMPQISGTLRKSPQRMVSASGETALP